MGKENRSVLGALGSATLLMLATQAPGLAAVDLGTYKGCSAKDTDFDFTPLVKKGTDTEEPLKLSFFQRADGTVDIYFVERKGAVKKYDGETKAVSLVGTIPCATGNDNGSAEAGPGNTADLSGGILRIHPDANLPKGYSIPAGNFGAHFAAKLQAQGNAALAREYADPAKVRPEIYVKGTRNAYSLSLDPVRRWLSWGDVGPDFGAVSEENNLVKEPYYTGWPYFAGRLDLTSIYGMNFPKKNRAAPMNTSAIAGVSQLPPNHEPIYVRSQNCAIDGPILRYDGANSYPGQIPPQLDRKWIVGDCNGSYGNHLLTLNAAGDSVIGDVKAFDLFHVAVVVDIQQGPDGAIYFIGWQSGIYRGDYKGQCRDPGLLPEKPGCADAKDPNYDPAIDPAFHDPRQCATATAIAPPAPRSDWLLAGGRGSR